MIADKKFLKQPLDFWANVKLISQKLGYTQKVKQRKLKKKKGDKTKTVRLKIEPLIKVPTIDEIKSVYDSLQLSSEKIVTKDGPTAFGSLLVEYFQHRANLLQNHVKGSLMNKDSAKALFDSLKKDLNPTCPIPMNKQSGDMQAPAYFTAIINMLIEVNSKGYECNYDPKELTSFTQDGFPVRSMSRRVDGSFPSVVNPIAIWEIKEYYYTKTFGSRIADGVYESLLDGFELAEIRNYLGRGIHHYLMVDDYSTWWEQGRSYLCRLCDMLHMGFITEVLFGKEVITRVPELVKQWTKQYDEGQPIKSSQEAERGITIKREQP